MNKSQNLTEQAYEHIRGLIKKHQLAGGTIYSERQFSSDIGISRTPFHAALQQLESEGYIDILPSRGFQLHEISKEDVIETFEIRSAIEFLCAYKLTQDYESGAPGCREAVDEMAALNEKMAASTNDIEQFVEYDFDFHAKMVAYGGSKVLMDSLKSHNYKMQNLAHRALLAEHRMEETLQQHEAIIQAVRMGDTDDIYAIIMEHLNSSRMINMNALG